MYKSPDWDSKPASLKKRILLEQRIVKHTVKALLTAGYALSVFDGENDSVVTTENTILIDALMETDEDFLNVYKDGKRIGWVRFVYGNDGYDVICDYTVNLEDALAETNKLAESLSN